MTNREEFTAWYLAAMIDLLGKGIESQARLNLEWLRDDGTFADPSLRLALMAWEASSETLLVKLPDDFTVAGSPNMRMLVEHHREIVGQLVQSIEAAGVKVKP